MVRREALLGIGGFLDDRFFMYWEDADLSARLRAAGWRVEEFAGGRIRHLGGASGGGADSVRRLDLYAWYTWGRHRWFSKHRPRWEAASALVLDALEVPRKALRALARPARRHEWGQARALAHVLWLRLRGREPARPIG